MSDIDIDIDEQYKALMQKTASGYQITLEEFSKIVVPWVRSHREVQFVLNAKPEPKEKKISKKDIIDKIKLIATSDTVSAEDLAFLNTYYKEVKLSKKLLSTVGAIQGFNPILPETEGLL